MGEQVAHIPRDAVEHIDGYQDRIDTNDFLGPAPSCDIAFAPEPEVEARDDRVEVVTYTVVYRPVDDSFEPLPKRPAVNRLSHYELFMGIRTTGAGEERLHGCRFLGWGGHANSTDRDLHSGEGNRALLWHAARREVREELKMTPAASGGATSPKLSPISPTPAGIIYTDEDDVSSDHVAAVYTLCLEDAEVREGDKYTGGWMAERNVEEMYLEDPAQFETWSKLLLPHLGEMVG